MTTETTQQILPRGYTFLNPKTLISEGAEKIVVKLLDEAADERDDDDGFFMVTDMYSYALMELIDRTLNTIHTKVIKKQWDEAWTYLEALTVFMDIEDSWIMADDAERTNITNKVYGASLVTTIRALQKETRFDSEHIPNLDTVLKTAAKWGTMMNGLGVDDCNYNLICQGIGKRLFTGKDDELKALHKARREEWIKTEAFDEAERDFLRRQIAEKEEEEEGGDPWYANEAADENDEDVDYTLSRVWKLYKSYLAG